MKFALSSLLALSLTPTATSSTLNKLSPRVISHETSHHCDDLTTAGHTTHGDCDDRKRHLASGGDVALSQTHVSSNDPITLTPKSWKATNERDDMYTVVLNFGSHDALSLSDLAQQVEVHVTHDLGTDIKTFDLALVASHGLDVAVGSYPMGTTTPTVTLKYPSFVQTVDRRRLAVSHVSYRKLRELGEEYHVRSAGAYQGVGSQGGCGDCYAWAARGVANEIERRVDGNGFSVRNLACQADVWFGNYGGCEGGWVDQTLNNMVTNKICKEKDVGWPNWNWGSDALECNTDTWWTDPGLDPSCDGGTGDKFVNPLLQYKSMEIERRGRRAVTDANINAMKNYMQSIGSISFSISTDNAFMYHGSETGWWGDCDDFGPYKGEANSCCKANKKKSCTWWGRCTDNSLECNGDKGGHAIRLVAYGTDKGEPYWKLQNSWGTSWGHNGYLDVSQKNSQWGWSRIQIDDDHMRRTLAQLPDFGLDYLMDEEGKFGRYLAEGEIDETEQEGGLFSIMEEETALDLATQAMKQFNCTIVPLTVEAFEEEWREPSIACISGITLKILDHTVVTGQLITKVSEYAGDLDESLSTNDYLELSKEMAISMYEAYNTTAMESVQTTLLHMAVGPLGLAVDSIDEAKNQVVDGYMWSLIANARPTKRGVDAAFKIKFACWVSGDFKNVKFNLQMSDGKHGFLDTDKMGDNGGTHAIGIRSARHSVEDLHEESMVKGSGGKKAVNVGLTAGLVCLFSALGVAAGFTIKHKLAAGRIKEMQDKLRTSEGKSAL